MVSIRMCVLALNVEGEKSNSVGLLVRERVCTVKNETYRLGYNTDCEKVCIGKDLPGIFTFLPMLTVFLISLVVEACIVKDLFEIFTFLPMLTLFLISLILEYA